MIMIRLFRIGNPAGEHHPVAEAQCDRLALQPAAIRAVATNQINEAGNFPHKARKDFQHLVKALVTFLRGQTAQG